MSSQGRDYASEVPVRTLKVVVNIVLEFARDSYRFQMGEFTNTNTQFGWKLWERQGQNLSSMLPYLRDESLRNLCHSLHTEAGQVEQLNNQWFIAFADFLKMPAPQTGQERDKFVKRIAKLTTKRDLEWRQNTDIQSVTAQTGDSLAKMENLVTQIMTLVVPLEAQQQGPVPPTREEFGDQRAKDLINKADNASDSKQHVRLLKKALSYGETGIQAAKAYERLALEYERQGDKAKAIEYYGRSVEAWHPFAAVFFARGRLYYELGQWDNARNDFEKVLEHGPKENSSESLSAYIEQAKQYLAKLNESHTP